MERKGGGYGRYIHLVKGQYQIFKRYVIKREREKKRERFTKHIPVFVSETEEYYKQN